MSVSPVAAKKLLRHLTIPFCPGNTVKYTFWQQRNAVRIGVFPTTMRFMPAYPDGPTAIVIPVPEAEPAVTHWRALHDPSALQGMPAHITVLYPFLPEAEITPVVINRLTQLISEQASFNITLAGCGRFSGTVLYLAPEPAQPLRALTEAVAAKWPETPPYGGLFDDVIPHLTVAANVEPDTARQIETALIATLPISATVREAWLYVPDGNQWVAQHRLPLASAG